MGALSLLSLSLIRRLHSKTGFPLISAAAGAAVSGVRSALFGSPREEDAVALLLLPRYNAGLLLVAVMLPTCSSSSSSRVLRGKRKRQRASGPGFARQNWNVHFSGGERS